MAGIRGDCSMTFSVFLIGFLIWGAISVKAQVSVKSFAQLEPFLHKNNDTTYVINFWTTWCKPCVKELPFFLELMDKWSDEALQVILVSLDFPNQLEKRLLPFVAKHGIDVPVILLDEAKANEWIPKVDESWTGSIPATLIYKNDRRAFYEKAFTYEELFFVVQKILRP